MYTATYTVLPDDTFNSIAIKYHTTVTELARLNHLQGKIPVKPKTSTIIVPLTGNGGVHIEDYLNNCKNVLGLDYEKVLLGQMVKSVKQINENTLARISGISGPASGGRIHTFSTTGGLTASLIKNSHTTTFGSNGVVPTAYKVTGKIKPNIDCWIQVGGESIIYMPCYPEPFGESITSQYTSESPLGRTEPMRAYTYTGPRSSTITWKLHREMYDNYNTVDNIVKVLLAAAYPKMSTTAPAVRTTIHIGKTFQISGIVTTVSADYDYPVIDDKFNQCIIKVTIEEVSNSDSLVPYYDRVKARGSYNSSNK